MIESLVVVWVVLAVALIGTNVYTHMRKDDNND